MQDSREATRSHGPGSWVLHGCRLMDGHTHTREHSRSEHPIARSKQTRLQLQGARWHPALLGDKRIPRGSGGERSSSRHSGHARRRCRTRRALRRDCAAPTQILPLRSRDELFPGSMAMNARPCSARLAARAASSRCTVTPTVTWPPTAPPMRRTSNPAAPGRRDGPPPSQNPRPASHEPRKTQPSPGRCCTHRTDSAVDKIRLAERDQLPVLREVCTSGPGTAKKQRLLQSLTSVAASFSR